MLTVTCSCGKSLKVKDEFAGKKVRCPGCSKVITIPSIAPESPAIADQVEVSEPPWKPTFIADPEPSPPETPEIDWSAAPDDDTPVRRKPRNVIPLPGRPALKTVEFVTQLAAYISILVSFGLIGFGAVTNAWPLCGAGVGMLFGSIAYLAYAELLRLVLDVEVRLHEISGHLAAIESKQP